MADCVPDGMDRTEENSEGGIELKIVESEEEEEEEDEPLDPRVQIELENLNSAADSINKLENELQKARAKFRLLKSESSHRLSSVNKKIGRKWVIKARPYFDLLRQSHKAQVEAQKSAIQYQRANGIYRAAKETVTLAEQQLLTEGGEKLAFDAAWQEMLNHATMRFMDAEKEKRITEKEHQAKAADYNSIQLRLQLLYKDMTRTITKAKPFYELKDKMESRLHAERQNAEDLHLALICSKQKYKMALSSLENISEDVHSNRLMKRNRLPPRTPGVGAESDTWSESSELPSANLDFMSETSSQASFEDFSDFDLDLSEWDDPPLSPLVDQGSEEGSIASALWSRFSNSGNKSKNNAGPSPDTQAVTGATAEASAGAGASGGGVGVRKTSEGLSSVFGSSPSHSEQYLKPPTRAPAGRRERPTLNESSLSAGSPLKSKLRATRSSDPAVRDNLVEGAESMPDIETTGKGDSDKLTRLERLRIGVSRSPSQPLPYTPSPLLHTTPTLVEEEVLTELSSLSVSEIPSVSEMARQDSTRSDGSGVSSPRGKPPLPFNRVSAGRHSTPANSSAHSSKVPSVRSTPDLSKSVTAPDFHRSSNLNAGQIVVDAIESPVLCAVTSSEENPAEDSLSETSGTEVTRPVDKSVPLNDEIFV